ncbi:MAG: TRL domain-containing protein [Bacteroidia bacterium]
MKKTLSFVSAIAVAAILTSCSVTVPLAVSAAPIGNKVGTSATTVIFGAWHLNKNFGIAEAAHNGKITGGVAIADLKVTNYVLFKKKEIIVQGN